MNMGCTLVSKKKCNLEDEEDRHELQLSNVWPNICSNIYLIAKISVRMVHDNVLSRPWLPLLRPLVTQPTLTLPHRRAEAGRYGRRQQWEDEEEMPRRPG